MNSSIFRATHRKLKRIVALKMIRPERLMRAADRRRFKNETRIIAQLDHPNIIDILHMDQIDGVHFFTMRMIQGRDLESRRSEYVNELPRAVRLVSAISTAIHYAHQHGVLHRDLRPSSVLVDESDMPYVVDFGLACRLLDGIDLPLYDGFQGTPAYSAPELLQQDPRPANVAADVYGLGAILYALLTGQPPFNGRNALEVWDKIRQTEPLAPRAVNSRVDPDLEAICMRALAKNPAFRHASAAALADDLDRYLVRELVPTRPVGWWQRRALWLRRHTIGCTIALMSAVAAFALLAVIAVQSIALRDQKEKTEAARVEGERYRQAMKEAEGNAQRVQADLRGQRDRPTDML